MKKYGIYSLIMILIILPGCSYFEGSNLQNVGMIFESSIDDNSWNEKGYQGLLEIEKEFKTDVFYKENIRSENEVARTVDEFVKKGVNLVIGHGNIYGSHFVELTKTYPEIHFIYMNGEIYNSNVTSLNFNSHAMGFFGGMIAGEMSETDQIGVIAVYSWQPELEGFYEGVKYENPNADIYIDFVNDWDDKERALSLYEEFEQAGIDIIFPIGNAYNEAVIQAAAEDGIYSLGYINDQNDIAPDFVLTSLIQHVDKVYVKAARDFNDEELVGGIRYYDFHNDYITLGDLNEAIPESFVDELLKGVEIYKESNLLPNEK